MVYRKPEQLFEAMKAGDVKYLSVLQSLSRYRRKEDLDSTILYVVSLEMYRHWCKVNNVTYKGDKDA